MNIIKKSSLTVLTLTSVFVFSQDHKFLNYPAYNENDLKKEYSLIEKDAPAEILYNSVDHYINTNGRVDSEYHTKVKIYDKSNAQEWLNLEIPKIDGDYISKFEVTISNYVNGKLEKITINKRENLVEKLTNGIKVYKLALPNVTDGAVIEYHYKKSTYQYGNLNQQLEYTIPVVYEEYSISYPAVVHLDFNKTGRIMMPKYQASYLDDKSTAKYQIFRFGYENIKSFRNENFLKSTERYRATLKPFVPSTLVNLYNEEGNNWTVYAKTLDTNDFFGGYLRGSVKNVLPNDIKTYYDKVERCNKILKFINENITWNKNYSFLASQTVKQTLKNASGNSADINLLMVSLMREAGIEAYPMLISTTDHGILNIIKPNIGDVNFVLATAKIEGQLLMFDATSKNSTVNVLPKRDWNDFGVLINKDTATDISFENTNVSEKAMVITGTLDPSLEEVSGILTQKDTKLYAIESFDEYEYNQEKYLQALKTNFAATISDIDIKVLENHDFISSMKFKTNAQIDKIGSKIIFNPLLFLSKDELTFDQVDERKNPIDFISAFIRNKRTEIVIPDGYTVGALPKPKKLSTDDKEIDYTYTAEIQGNKLIVTSKVSVASQNYPKEYYKIFQQVWKVIQNSESQVVSLIKK